MSSVKCRPYCSGFAVLIRACVESDIYFYVGREYTVYVSGTRCGACVYLYSYVLCERA